MSKIVLPKKDKITGKYMISYSQIKLWNDLKGYNTGLSGRKEYIMAYFLNQKWEDKGGFAQFGIDVEDYITKREGAHKFDVRELETLNSIKTLGIFQKELALEFDGFVLKGFIDDCAPDYSKIRDYKGASLNSAKKYYEEEYNQLDVYALGIKQEQGVIPKELEVCVIERLGNGFRGGRNVMKVGENVWYIARKTDKAKLKELNTSIIKTATEISDYYKVFLKLNK